MSTLFLLIVATLVLAGSCGAMAYVAGRYVSGRLRAPASRDLRRDLSLLVLSPFSRDARRRRKVRHLEKVLADISLNRARGKLAPSGADPELDAYEDIARRELEENRRMLEERRSREKVEDIGRRL